MEYVLIDGRDGNLFTKEFATEEEAIAAGQIKWDHLTDMEKTKRDSFYVVWSDDPDEDSEDHLEGTIMKDWKEFWFAVLTDEDDDNDWGTGSFSLYEAKKMAMEYEEGYIAVIDVTGISPKRVAEISQEDFYCYGDEWNWSYPHY